MLLQGHSYLGSIWMTDLGSAGDLAAKSVPKTICVIMAVLLRLDATPLQVITFDKDNAFDRNSLLPSARNRVNLLQCLHRMANRRHFPRSGMPLLQNAENSGYPSVPRSAARCPCTASPIVSNIARRLCGRRLIQAFARSASTTGGSGSYR